MFSPENSGLPQAPDRLERAAHRLIAKGLSPEEYAGRHGANILVFSLHKYRYLDPEVDTYVKRLGYILSMPDLLTQCEILHQSTGSATTTELKEQTDSTAPDDQPRLWRRRRRPPAAD